MSLEALSLYQSVIATARSRADLAEWWALEKPIILERYGVDAARQIHAAVTAHAACLVDIERRAA